MFGSAILETIIGLIFIFLLISIICSAIREALEAWLKTRAAYLEHGIRQLLHDPNGTGLAKHFYDHPIIYPLYAGVYRPGRNAPGPAMLARGHSLPSYVPSKDFALTVMDMAARGPHTDAASADGTAPALTTANIRANLAGLDNPQVQRALLTALDSAQGDIERVREHLAAWFDSSMDRVSGWYKRSTQWTLFAIAMVVAVGMNIDAITIGSHLYHNDALREALVAQAEHVTADSTMPTSAAARELLDELGLPIGWGARATDAVSPFHFGRDVARPFFGWLATALAVTMGAPFWFDLLNKVMVIRSTVKPREKSPEEGSEDRQPSARRGDASAVSNGGTTSRAVFINPPEVAAGAIAATTPVAIGVSVPIDHEEPEPDTESERDACDDHFLDETMTTDEELPPAYGGVA